MRAFALVVFVLAGCGQTAANPDSGASSATSTGTMNGAPFAAIDSTFNASVPSTTVSLWSTLFSMSKPAISGSMTTVLVSNTASTCTTFEEHPSTAIEFLAGLFDADANGNAVGVTAPGTYAVLNPTFGQGQVPTIGKTAFVMAATCNAAGYTGYVGDGGTITVSDVSSSRIVGSFDIKFNDGGETTGTFSAASCPTTITDKLCRP